MALRGCDKTAAFNGPVVLLATSRGQSRAHCSNAAVQQYSKFVKQAVFCAEFTESLKAHIALNERSFFIYFDARRHQTHPRTFPDGPNIILSESSLKKQTKTDCFTVFRSWN